MKKLKKIGKVGITALVLTLLSNTYGFAMCGCEGSCLACGDVTVERILADANANCEEFHIKIILC
jgi:hypothetical protein